MPHEYASRDRGERISLSVRSRLDDGQSTYSLAAVSGTKDHGSVHRITESWSLMKIRLPASTGYAYVGVLATLYLASSL